jgi:major membrane immunogen (membrane-anchored lipoprotein)
MKTKTALAPLALSLSLLATAPALAAGKTTDCEMDFTLKGWSAFYKVAHGKGTITCDNGQKARVTIEAKGGGLTAGRSEIREGHGKFSDVSDIRELFGSYANAGAAAGAGKSAEAQVVTKGDVSLALSGKGTGIELGVSFGKFTISKR